MQLMFNIYIECLIFKEIPKYEENPDSFIKSIHHWFTRSEAEESRIRIRTYLTNLQIIRKNQNRVLPT